MLTNPPEATTVGEILRVLEGSLSPVDCVDHPNCANSDHCVSLSIWKKMKVALDEVVDNITLADMAAEYAGFANAAASLCVENFGGIPSMPLLADVEKRMKMK